MHTASEVYFGAILEIHGQSLAPEIPQPINVYGLYEVKYVNIEFLILDIFSTKCRNMCLV